MKKTFITAALLISQLSFAAVKFPATIHCKAPKALSKMVRSFSITDLNTESPKSSIPDTSSLDHTNDRDYILQVSFSNECDNSYGLIFYAQDLARLAKGEIKKVSGLMNYSDAFMPEKPNRQSDEETITVICTL